jgi:pimeloyl-ACP methyl ester carboxylesterase
MPRRVLPLAAWITAFLGGCTAQQQSRCLIEHGSTIGAFRLAMLPGAKTLQADGQIDAHERIIRDCDTAIDVWMIRARDGSGEPTDQARGTVVLLHGLWDSKARFFGLGKRLARDGFNVVLPDNRCHGGSTGRYITWGAKEKHDVKAVMDAMIRDYGLSEEIYVVGLSMGGGIAVQYAALDPRVQGCLAIAPVADIQSVAARMFPLTGSEKLTETIAQAGRTAGFDPSEASAVQAARRLHCPLIIVHGRADMTVPIAQGRAIYSAASGPRQMHEVPLAGHYTVLLGREKWFARQVDRLDRGRIDSHDG